MNTYYYQAGELTGMIQGVLLVLGLMIGVAVIIYLAREIKN